MANDETQNMDDSPLRACTVSRDVQVFDILIEDMETVMGEAWGDLGFADAIAFMDQLEPGSLEFIALALDYQDEDDLELLKQVIQTAKSKSIKVIVVAEDVTPAALHQLLKTGADEFVPYPLPENELANAVERLKQADVAPAPQAPEQ